MIDLELARIAQRGLALLPSPLLRHHAKGRHEVREGVAFCSWGMAGPSFNKAAVFGPAPPLARIRELADAFFGGAGGYGVMVQADAGHPVEAELRGAGWPVVENEAALVLPVIPPAPPAPPLPPGLEVRRVTDDAGRRDFIVAAAAGFGAPTAEAIPASTEEDFEGFGPSLSAVRDPDIAVVVGYASGRPVSCALVHRVEEIGCVTGVATVPDWRRHGLARALTWAALREGVGCGCRCAALNAQGASYHLYVGMGFVPVGNHRTYAEGPA